MIKVKKFPRLDGNICWYDTSPYKDQTQGATLTSHLTYDYVIIGAGFNGVATARRLAELQPQAKIALIDALKIGQGSSGRNSGFMLEVPHIARVNSFNFEEGAQLLKLNRFSIARIKETLDQNNLKPDWVESGIYLIASEEKNHAKIDHAIEILKKLDEPYEVLGQSALTQKLGTNYYTKAIHTPGGITVNPASLIMGLAKTLPANVTIYEDCPLRAMQLEGNKLLKFDKGEISAGNVIITTNAFNEALKISKSRLAPMFTYISMTRVLNDKELSSFKDATSYGLLSAHEAGTSVRFTADKRILIRNSVRPSLTSSQSFMDKAVKQHRQSLTNFFPHLSSVPFEYSWGGNICMTLNGRPQFNEAKEGVYSIAGMNASGIVKGNYLGYYMAEYICGNQSPELDFILQHSQPSWVPPEPLRTIGATASIRLVERSAGKEM